MSNQPKEERIDQPGYRVTGISVTFLTVEKDLQSGDKHREASINIDVKSDGDVSHITEQDLLQRIHERLKGLI